MIEVKVPLGDSEVAVIELLVKVGDTVKQSPGHGRERQGFDGDSVQPRRRGQGTQDRRGRQGQRRQRCCWCWTARTSAAAAGPQPRACSGGPGASAAARPRPLRPRSPRRWPVVVPDIGDFRDVAVIELFVKAGDTVKVEQSLITVESDKASMEIPSSHAGVVEELLVKLGDKVRARCLVRLKALPAALPRWLQSLQRRQPAPAAATAAAAAAPAVVPRRQPACRTSRPAPAGPAHASPGKFARELGVPLAEVRAPAQGPHHQDDVQAFTKAGDERRHVQTQAQRQKAPAHRMQPGAVAAAPGLLPWPKVDFAKFGPVERKRWAAHQEDQRRQPAPRNWVIIPHVTNHDDADITDLKPSAFSSTNKRTRRAASRSPCWPSSSKAAVVAALKKFPSSTARWTATQLVLKNYFHIGFAADTPNGLVVPVIKDADKKGILQISQEWANWPEGARRQGVGPADMTGGCFSISSLGGGIGGTLLHAHHQCA